MSALTMIPLSGLSVVSFVPQFFAQDTTLPDAKKPTFSIRVPTFAMRDKMSALLMERGLLPATLTQSRGILIDALYELHDEAKADEYATFLEDYWVRSEIHEELVQAWSIREAQRLFDKGMGVRKELPQEPIPPSPYTMREQARQARIVTEVLERSDRYRTYQAKFLSQQEAETEMTVRLFLAGWKNCVTESGDSHVEVVPNRDELDRLTEDSIEGLRTWFAEQGAKTAWDEIKQAVMAQFGGNGGLEKNFDSPLDLNSSQNGSPASSGNSESSDGSSTTSSITPTRGSKSPVISASSRNSRSGKGGKGKPASRRNGPAAAAT